MDNKRGSEMYKREIKRFSDKFGIKVFLYDYGKEVTCSIEVNEAIDYEGFLIDEITKKRASYGNVQEAIKDIRKAGYTGQIIIDLMPV
jgi:hypothetical protein